MEKIKELAFKFFEWLLFPTRETSKVHSMYALMENGPMKKGSIGRIILQILLQAYNTEYKDKADKEAILSSISANYRVETEGAWQAFLAEIDEPDE